MLILALDTTLAACSVALYDSDNEEVRGHECVRMQKGHAEALAGMAEQVASKAGVGFGQLDRIAVTTGPGTFTGVRIGLAMARGLGVALNIPVVGVSTLQAIAANVDDNPDQLPIAVVMDARREAVYVQMFSPLGEPLSDPHCMELDGISEQLPDDSMIVIGSGVDFVACERPNWQRSQASELPDARLIARIARELMPEDTLPVPLYLRPADAKPQESQIRLARLPVTISAVDRSHAGILASMHSECFPAGWREQDIADMLASPGVSALIAAQSGDSEPAGFILLRQAADETEIITMCVRPHVRRRGIAAQMLEQAVKQLGTLGSTKLFLGVQIDNTTAQSLYTSAGFVETARRKDYYKLEDGSSADAVIMALAF